MSLLLALTGSSAVTGTLAWSGQNDSWSLTGAAVVSGAISFIGQNDTWSLVSTVSNPVTGTIAWTSQNDTWEISGSSAQALRGGVGPEDERKHRIAAWDTTRGLTPELRDQIRKQLESEAQPVREVITAQARTMFESMEAEERALQAAIRAAKLEYEELYMRLVAYQRDQMEEEAVVMTIMALL